MKILTWNIGNMFWLKYAKYFGLKYKGIKIDNEYFAPKLNGHFVSETLAKINADFICLQEFWQMEHADDIKFLENYPHKKFFHSWYHKHAILVASKNPFTYDTKNNFPIINCSGFSIIPIHLNSFSAKKRMGEVSNIIDVVKNLNNFIILGDTNIWTIYKQTLFKKDRQALNNILKIANEATHQTKSTTIIGAKLDRIFCSKNLPKVNSKVIKTRGHFMDHYPVFCEV